MTSNSFKGSPCRSWVVQYYHEIESGNTLVGNELKMQLDKLMKELTDPEYQECHNIKIDYEDSEKKNG